MKRYYPLSLHIKPVLVLALLCLFSVINQAKTVLPYSENDYSSPQMYHSMEEIWIWIGEKKPVVTGPVDLTPINVEVVLSNIKANKDLEFSRGFLMALRSLNLPDTSVNLKIVNGAMEKDSLFRETDDFGPDLVILTHEKNVPQGIIDYSLLNPTRLALPFDATGDAYLANNSMYQIISPSSEFNKNTARYLGNKLEGYSLIILGEPDPSDPLLPYLMKSFPADKTFSTEARELDKISVDPGMPYLTYMTSVQKADVDAMLGAIDRFKKLHPDNDVKVLGRASLMGVSGLSPLMKSLEVMVPSKCYFDPTSAEGKAFIKEYKNIFGHAPVKSTPMYAAMGYDVASYFIPELLYARRDGRDIAWDSKEGIQSNMDIERADEGQGYYNAGIYLLQFKPDGKIEKIAVN